MKKFKVEKTCESCKGRDHFLYHQPASGNIERTWTECQTCGKKTEPIGMVNTQVRK